MWSVYWIRKRPRVLPDQTATNVRLRATHTPIPVHRKPRRAPVEVHLPGAPPVGLEPTLEGFKNGSPHWGQYPDALRPMLAAAQPIPRAGEAEDIAGAALWLTSDDSALVSGQIIAVCGGASAVAVPGGRPWRDRMLYGPPVRAACQLLDATRYRSRRSARVPRWLDGVLPATSPLAATRAVWSGSLRPEKRIHQVLSGAPSRTRTDTWRILSPLPLPIGLWGPGRECS